MKKIVIAGFNNVGNLGDPVLFECTEYLVRKSIEELSLESEIATLDLIPNSRNLLYRGANFLQRIYDKKGFRKDSISTKHHSLRQWLFSLMHRKKYSQSMKGASAVILAGGGLIKYKYENCNYRINILIEEAKKIGVPIYFNAVGVEGYSSEDVKCQELKKSLNSDIVKVVSTRDDIDLLNAKYINNRNILTKKVADSAFWANELYGIERDTESNIIGLGVIRGGIFKDNGYDITESDLLELWVRIIHELNNKELKWKLFTNGLQEDNAFVDLLLAKLNLSDKKQDLSLIPTDPSELVSIISKFEKIIACRMHTSIIAYSLNVPSIGLVWNNKIKMFGESVGHADRFISHEDFVPQNIVEKLISTNNSDDDIEQKNSYRLSTYHGLHDFLSKFDEFNHK